MSIEMSIARSLKLVCSGLAVIAAMGAHPAAASSLPANCQAIRTADPAAPDGNYAIQAANGRVLNVYCFDMAGTPREYLSLLNTGGSYNFGQYTAGGASPGTDVRTNYTRVRLDPATLLVDIADQTFATSTGGLNHGGTPVTSMPYGVAMSCRGFFDASGLANIDLTGTTLAVVNTFVLGGFVPGGTTTLSANNQVADLTGGGFCGWNAPAPLFNPFNTNAGFNLQLTFLSYAGTPADANCHGQSVAALAVQYGGLSMAATALGFPSVSLMQLDIRAFCEE